MEYIIDLHTHTVASGHAYSTLIENVNEAKKKGLKVYGVSDHACSLPGGAHIFHIQNMRIIPNIIDGIRILKGVEANIISHNGNIDMTPEDLMATDYVIASMHPPCITPNSIAKNTSAMLGAIKNPLVNIIGHPDDSRFSVDYDTIVAAAKEYGVMLELNNTSMNPKGFRQDARVNNMKILELCKRYKTSIIMGSDAHIAYDVGQFNFSIDILKEVNFPKELIVNDSIDKLKTFIPQVAEINN